MATQCSNCQAAIPEGAKFCPECGAAIAARSPKSLQSNTPARKAAKAKGNGLRDTLIIVGALAVITALYFTFRTPVTPPQPPAADQSSAGQMQPGMTGQDGMMGASMTNLPTDYNSLVQAGNMEMDRGNYPVAAEAYRRALVIDSSSTDVRTDYGACLHGMGMPDRAIQEFKRVLAMQPKHAIAHFNLGIVYYQSQQPDSARAYWNEYLEIDPNGTAAASAREYLKQVGG